MEIAQCRSGCFRLKWQWRKAACWWLEWLSQLNLSDKMSDHSVITEEFSRMVFFLETLKLSSKSVYFYIYFSKTQTTSERFICAVNRKSQVVKVQKIGDYRMIKLKCDIYITLFWPKLRDHCKRENTNIPRVKG